MSGRVSRPLTVFSSSGSTAFCSDEKETLLGLHTVCVVIKLASWRSMTRKNTDRQRIELAMSALVLPPYSQPVPVSAVCLRKSSTYRVHCVLVVVVVAAAAAVVVVVVFIRLFLWSQDQIANT